MAPISLWALYLFGIVTAANPPTENVSDELLMDDLMLEIYGVPGHDTKIASAVSSAAFMPATTPAPQVEDTCPADCQVRYSPVTVYEWQPVSITATSTIVKNVFTEAAAGGSEAVIRHNPIEDQVLGDSEYQSRNGLPFSTLAVTVDAATKVVDVFYPTPVTVYPRSYNWEGNLMTQIGNPRIGMVWTCIRDLRTPIKEKVTPPKGKEIWELGNVTSSVDQNLVDGSYWRLVPRLRTLDQKNAKELFPEDIALGVCTLIEGSAQEATTSIEYGIKYVTVTSTLAEGEAQATPAATPNNPIPSSPPAATASVTSVPVVNPMPTSSNSINSLPARPSDARGQRIRTENRAPAGTLELPSPQAKPSTSSQDSPLMVYKPKKVTGLTLPTPSVVSAPVALPVMAETPAEYSDADIQAISDFITSVYAYGQSLADNLPENVAADNAAVKPSPGPLLGVLSGLATTPSTGGHGVHAPDPIVSFGTKPQNVPQPVIVNEHRLTPQVSPEGPRSFKVDDGQTLVKDGPAITLIVPASSAGDSHGGSAQSGAGAGPEKKVLVNYVSGAGGSDVLVVDGVSSTIATIAATGAPYSGFGDSSYSGQSYGGGQSSSQSGSRGSSSSGSSSGSSGSRGGSSGGFSGGSLGSSSDGGSSSSSNPPASLGKIRPAQYQGPESSAPVPVADTLQSGLVAGLVTVFIVFWMY